MAIVMAIMALAIVIAIMALAIVIAIMALAIVTRLLQINLTILVAILTARILFRHVHNQNNMMAKGPFRLRFLSPKSATDPISTL